MRDEGLIMKEGLNITIVMETKGINAVVPGLGEC